MLGFYFLNVKSAFFRIPVSLLQELLCHKPGHKKKWYENVAKIQYLCYK
jgi:hypothetical protein